MKLKEERDKQWGSNKGRGWDRYRITTFLEIIEAKAGRAIIAQELCSQDNNSKYLIDLTDSLEDLINYSQKCLSILKEDTSNKFATGYNRDECNRLQQESSQ